MNKEKQFKKKIKKLAAVNLLLNIAAGGIITVAWYANMEYVCPKCGTKFRPGFLEFLGAKHTPRKRKLTCPECDFVGYCREKYIDKDEKEAVSKADAE